MPTVLDRNQIAELLPHRGFMLLPQTFKSFDNEGVLRGVATMEIFPDNVFLPCHFGCIPGVILIELINQAAALLIMTELKNIKTPMVMAQKDPEPRYGIQPVIAGHIVTVTVILKRAKRGMFYLEGRGTNQNGLRVVESGVVGTDAERAVPRLPPLDNHYHEA